MPSRHARVGQFEVAVLGPADDGDALHELDGAFDGVGLRCAALGGADRTDDQPRCAVEDRLVVGRRGLRDVRDRIRRRRPERAFGFAFRRDAAAHAEHADVEVVDLLDEYFDRSDE